MSNQGRKTVLLTFSGFLTVRDNTGIILEMKSSGILFFERLVKIFKQGMFFFKYKYST